MITLKDLFIKLLVTRPLEISKVLKNYDVKCSVKGGGLVRSSWCILFMVFLRALVSFDENLKKVLKKEKLTTRNSRVVERKKYGHRKARRSFQFSKVKSFKFINFFMMI